MAFEAFKNLSGTTTEFVLEVEERYFREHEKEFRTKYPGKAIVVRSTYFVGAFDTVEIAIREATERFGTVPCLIKEIDAGPLTKGSPLLRINI